MTQIEIDQAASPPHRACSQLNIRGLSDDTVSRFIHGLDEAPVLLSAEEATAQLRDQFAVRLLNAGIFPNTAGEVLHALEQIDAGGPLATQRFFLVGEGSQLSADVSNAQRNMRFLISCGPGPEGAEVVVSSFHPDQGMVEVMAWDHGTGGFNFYRTMPDSNAWIFAGNSHHALVTPTRGHGPFESHINGNILMKELKVPWVNWHSPFAQIPATSLASQGLDTHPWVKRLEPGGGYTLEDETVRPGIIRWSAARADAITAGTSAETPARMLEQLLSTLTVNLISSQTTSVSAVGGSSVQVDLPSTFFVDADMLGVVGLPAPPRLKLASSTYAQTLIDLAVELGDGDLFVQPGDTHFAFVVPERAFEDVATVREALRAGLLTPRLVASLLMVDFSNPVFSSTREALLAHLDGVAWNGSGPDFSEAVAHAIITSDKAATPGTAEASFAENWAVGEDFVAPFTARLNSYYALVEQAIATPEGFADVYGLAESRRNRVKDLPIFESQLLFSNSDLPPAARLMTVTASVEEIS